MYLCYEDCRCIKIEEGRIGLEGVDLGAKLQLLLELII
jgi:hypothetical protein